jgi:hypothetical protein
MGLSSHSRHDGGLNYHAGAAEKGQDIAFIADMSNKIVGIRVTTEGKGATYKKDKPKLP